MIVYRSDRTNAHVLKAFNANLGKELRKPILVTVVFVLAGRSASYARAGMHGPGTHGLMTPANQQSYPR